LQKARDAAGKGEDVEAVLDDVSMELTTVMSTLQFQDITSQQIEGAHAVLAALGNGLGKLVVIWVLPLLNSAGRLQRSRPFFMPPAWRPRRRRPNHRGRF